jgi:predicted aspartyl protease
MLIRYPFLWFLASLLSLPCQAAKEPFTGSEVFQIPFRVVADSLIVVPVMVNGAGPFDFALDTGSSATTIDRKLAEKLALPATGRSVDIGALERSNSQLVHAETLSVGKGTAANLDLIVRKNMNSVLRIFGILGEDYLRKFDLMIDNQHHIVFFDPDSGSLALGLLGEHLEIGTTGNYRGEQTRNRVILKGRADELGTATFLVDSGANNMILFLPLNKWKVLGIPFASLITNASGATNESPARTQFVRKLSFGVSHLANLTVLALPGRDEVDVDALLPTMIFDRIFLCHSDNFVIFNPTSKRR